MKRISVVAVLAMCFAGPSDARSRTQINHFRASHPCPATAHTKGACTGYVVDHVMPLCAGGLDHPGNMQWQTVAEAKVKDRAERARCRRR